MVTSVLCHQRWADRIYRVLPIVRIVCKQDDSHHTIVGDAVSEIFFNGEASDLRVSFDVGTLGMLEKRVPVSSDGVRPPLRRAHKMIEV